KHGPIGQRALSRQRRPCLEADDDWAGIDARSRFRNNFQLRLFLRNGRPSQRSEAGVTQGSDALPALSRLVGSRLPPLALATQSISGTPALRKPAKYVLSTRAWI